MSDKKTLHTPQREVPQNTKSTVVRLFSQLRGQRAVSLWWVSPL